MTFASWLVVLAACSTDDRDTTEGAVTDGTGGAAWVATGGAAAPPAAVLNGSGGSTAIGSAGGASSMLGTGGASAMFGTGGASAMFGTGGASGVGGVQDAGSRADSVASDRDGAAVDARANDAGNSGSRIQHVFVIALENHDEGSVIGNMRDAPYINGELLVKYASASDFVDRLSLGVPSEPHYVWMEAGTNAFAEHLATQLSAAGLTWMAYQEGIDAGSCPIQSSGYYQPKHDPFIFFRDVSGDPPSKSDPECAAHHKPYGVLADDLMHDAVAHYNFITPDQCHDMHGQSGCPNDNTIGAGDDWLRDNVPPLIEYCDAHDGVVFLIFDEGESTLQMPFLALGARVKPGYVSAAPLDHGSLAKSVETIFDLPVLSKVSAAHDFGDLFRTGMFP
jgi:hypothetical protein